MDGIVFWLLDYHARVSLASVKRIVSYVVGGQG